MNDAYLSTFLQPGGDPHVLCFVDFDNPAQATIALEALQGETTYICGYGLCSSVDFLLLNFCDFQFCMYMLVQFYNACLHLSIVCCEACFENCKYLFIPHLTSCEFRNIVFKLVHTLV